MRLKIIIGLLLAGITLAAYWPVGNLGFIFLDDPDYVTENAAVQGGITPGSVVWAFSTAHAANWHPVTWLSHMVDCELFGLRPGGPHWVNLGLHIANTLLLFMVLMQLTQNLVSRQTNAAAGVHAGREAGASRPADKARGDNASVEDFPAPQGGRGLIPGGRMPPATAVVTTATTSFHIWRSALVAALFAVHPLHIQSVAWVAERKDVLSGFFFLLTLWAYARYAQSVTSDEWRVAGKGGAIPAPDATRDTRHATLFYWLALIFFALGLMSKPMLVTLPLVLLLLDYWPLGRVTSDMWRVTRFRIPVPQLSTLKHLLFEKWPFFALSAISCLATLYAQGHGGAILHVWWLPWYMRMLVAPVFYTAYLGELFWPVNLAIFQPYSRVYGWQMAGAGLLVTGLTVFCFRQARTRAWWFTGWFWFLVMLVPVIGLVQVGTQSLADRYTYLPAIGVFMVAAWGLGELAAISGRWRTGVTLAATAAVVACLAGTRHQLRYWRDDTALFGHALEVAPENNSMSHYCLGLARWKSGDLDGAVRDFRAALKISPDFSDASGRLGFILLQQNRPAEAEVEFRNVVRVLPGDTKAHKHLGDTLVAQGKLAEAEAEYETVLRLNPGNALVSEALRPEMVKLEIAKTLTNLYATLKVQPTAEAHAEIAAIRATQGEFQEASEHYLAALRLKPDSPDILNNLAWLLATCPDDKVRDGAQAVQYAERACELTKNQQTQMLGTLAAAYAEAGRFEDAVATAQKACDLATQQGETGLLQKNRDLLELYRAHKPWRE